jgi:hypothetical protein
MGEYNQQFTFFSFVEPSICRAVAVTTNKIPPTHGLIWHLALPNLTLNMAKLQIHLTGSAWKIWPGQAGRVDIFLRRPGSHWAGPAKLNTSHRICRENMAGGPGRHFPAPAQLAKLQIHLTGSAWKM